MNFKPIIKINANTNKSNSNIKKITRKNRQKYNNNKSSMSKEQLALYKINRQATKYHNHFLNYAFYAIIFSVITTILLGVSYLLNNAYHITLAYLGIDTSTIAWILIVACLIFACDMLYKERKQQDKYTQIAIRNE